MNNSHSLTAENILQMLPDVLKNDTGMAALATAVAQVLPARLDEIQGLMIYSQIDSLPEYLLDILAYDFKVDWWDGDYSLEEKRRTLRDSWRVHRMLGTKAAVETAISAIYPATRVSEWFEYGGEPYHFKLLIDVTHEDIDPVKHRRVLDRVEYYKNLRSCMDAVEYLIYLYSFKNGPGELVFQAFAFQTSFTNRRGEEIIVLDGSKLLDGTWQLNQAFLGVIFPAFSVETAIAHSEAITATFIFDNWWALDGAVTLDGSHTLDAQITEEEI